jgi:hypothetical protein
MVTRWDRPGAPLDPATADLLVQSWGNEHTARLFLHERKPVDAAQRASRMMLSAAQTLVWERHRLRCRVRATFYAAFWEHVARPDGDLIGC